MGTGHYRDPYLDRGRFDRNDHVAIGEGLVGQIMDGRDGVRPGIIGEIGGDREYGSAAEDRSSVPPRVAMIATSSTLREVLPHLREAAEAGSAILCTAEELTYVEPGDGPEALEVHQLARSAGFRSWRPE